MNRSENMARIRSQDTAPELRLRRLLWHEGLRYRVHARTPYGRPDVVFPGRRIAVFVDGCQWHGCPLHYVRPRSSSEFWSEKLATNLARDRRQTELLRGADWQVLRFWEHEIDQYPRTVVAEVQAAVQGRAFSALPAWRVVRVEPVGEGSLERRVMEALLDPSQVRIELQERRTTKWRRKSE